MAHVRYLDRDLTTGLNDGTSEANAWQSLLDIVWDYGLYLHWKSAVYAETGTYTLPTLAEVDNEEAITVEGYETTPGDGGYAVADMGGYRLYNNGSVSNIWFKNMEFTGGNVWGSPFLSGSILVYLSNCRFINTYVDPISRGAIAADIYRAIIEDCYFESRNTGLATAVLQDCSVSRCVFNAAAEGVWGVHMDINGIGFVKDSIFKFTGTGKSGYGIYMNNGNVQKPIQFENNVFDGFSAAVYNFEQGPFNDLEKPYYIHNIFSNCELAFEEGGAGTQEQSFHVGTNAYYNVKAKSNTILGHSNSVGFGIECLVDPFVDRVNGDFNLNDAATGGALLKNIKTIGSGILSNLPNLSYGAIQAGAQIVPPVAAVTVPAAILMVI